MSNLIGKKFHLGNGLTVTITEDGEVNTNGLATVKTKKLSSADDSAMSIWQMYKNYRSNDVVIRSGSGLCGVYPFDPKHATNPNYIESDTLHSTTVEELAQNIFRFHPDLFDHLDQKRIIDLLRYHDLGETVDNPDDGSKDRDEKFEEELKTFKSKISSLPLDTQKALIKDFIIFENAGLDIWQEEDRRPMQFAKLCDKCDAPLGAILYEFQGRNGSLLYKKKHYGGITEQDQKYADEIGEYSQVGIWTAHMIDTYSSYENVELFIDIIVNAFIDVHGHIMPWLYEFLKKRNLHPTLVKELDATA